MHQTHDDKFVPGKNSKQAILKESSSSDKDTVEKKVTFNAVKDKEDSEPEPQLKVKEELLRDAKAYLAQYSDFRQGGMQGS